MVKKTMMHKEIGEIKTDLEVLKEVVKEKFRNIEKSLKNIDRAISGNGQPGLVQKLALDEDRLDKHIIDDANWKGIKDGSISNMKWGIGIGLSILTMAIVLVTFI